MDKYSFGKYLYFSRWVSYWHQISETLALNSRDILIIGKGDGIVSDILRKYIDVKMLDIDKDLKPDFVASVENMPFQDNAFDIVLCAEVLEHLPFERFEKCITELRRTAKKYVVLSLPHFGPPVKFSFKFPLIKDIQISFKTPFPLKHQKQEHQWEIGKKGYPLWKIRKILKKYFIIKKEFIPFENQYHHFYILEKI